MAGTVAAGMLVEPDSGTASARNEGAATSLASRLDAAIARNPGLVGELAEVLEFYASHANYRDRRPFCSEVVSDGGGKARKLIQEIGAEDLDRPGALPIPTAGDVPTRPGGDRPRGHRARRGGLRLQEARR